MKTSRCAIYTRKASEEGLEQSFNSLHAQREACEAYITSQKHEGWHALSAKYDDGGFSGGNMVRPDLRSCWKILLLAKSIPLLSIRLTG
jgi:site-specific DNA recombinase